MGRWVLNYLFTEFLNHGAWKVLWLKINRYISPVLFWKSMLLLINVRLPVSLEDLLYFWILACAWVWKGLYCPTILFRFADQGIAWEVSLELRLIWMFLSRSRFVPMQKHALMEQVAHQTIVMQFILELARSLKVDPRACFRQFFTKIKVGAWITQDYI